MRIHADILQWRSHDSGGGCRPKSGLTGRRDEVAGLVPRLGSVEAHGLVAEGGLGTSGCFSMGVPGQCADRSA